MNKKSRYEQYTWIAPLIREIKPALNWMKLYMPANTSRCVPHEIFDTDCTFSVGASEDAMLSGTVKDPLLFDYLVSLHFQKLHPEIADLGKQYPPAQFISPLRLPIESGRDALTTIATSLSVQALNVFLMEYVKAEQYEEAAIIKAELDSRPPLARPLHSLPKRP